MSDDEDTASLQEDLSIPVRQNLVINTTSGQQSNTSSPILRHTHNDMKRSAVKELIERYFYQLQKGCGNLKCCNDNCASSGKVPAMSPNEIAAKAIQLFSQDAKLCDFYTQPTKVPRTETQHDSPSSSNSTSGATTPNHERNGNSTGSSTGYSGSNTISTIGLTSPNDGANINTLDCSFKDATVTKNISISKSSAKVVVTPVPNNVEYLNEQMLDELIDECMTHDNYESLIHAINEVFCSVEKLSKSFKRSSLPKLTSSNTTATKLQELLGKSPKELNKEDLRTLEGEHDKDEDCTCSNPQSTVEVIDSMDEECISSNNLSNVMLFSQNSDTDVDLESFRRIRNKLFSLNNAAIGEAINSNIILLTESIRFGRVHDWDQILHCFVICFDMAAKTSNLYADLEYLERSLPKLCQAAATMPVVAQARLARIWATHCKDQLKSFVQCCQQLITLQVILDEESAQENLDVIAITKILKIVFYANILAGEFEQSIDITSTSNHQSMPTSTLLSAGDEYGASAAEGSAISATTDSSFASISASMNTTSTSDEDDIFLYNQVPKSQHFTFTEDKLEKELNISRMDCRVPLIPYEEFYNEPLSDAIQMDRDYLSYKNLSLDLLGKDNHFSFMLYSFILTPATKVVALYYDSRIRMYSERNSSLYSLLNYFGDGNDTGSRLDLKLKVRRDNIVDDALIGLELVAMSNPKDLKKQLVVEFVGEQGIDEGGVSKEFFQLIVEEIFNPDFGMFTYQEDTNTVWFNSAPFENEAQYTLIGIIIGLAIYNNIILAVNFPRVVYRKLMGGQGTFYDLQDWNPTLHRSLKSFLDYQEPDMEDVFMQTFKINYKNIFDEIIEHELKPNGSDIMVGQHNKHEFVNLYSDFLLNKNVERQFKAFKRGFDMVTDESPLKLLFRPEEVELLVCGSTKFDFLELEKSTEYEGGYSKDTQIIIDFWNIVHSLPENSKRKLLEFTTGSDRVPVGGLSRLKLLITRHGPDSDRLPTSHTCFNVLLLPEYNSKEKLEERLLKAINYSKGFGML